MIGQKTLFRFISQVEVSMIRKAQVSSPKYSCSEEIAESELAKDFIKSDIEKFICIHLNTKNQLISFEVVSTGSLTASTVRLATLSFERWMNVMAHLA